MLRAFLVAGHVTGDTEPIRERSIFRTYSSLKMYRDTLGWSDDFTILNYCQSCRLRRAQI